MFSASLIYFLSCCLPHAVQSSVFQFHVNSRLLLALIWHSCYYHIICFCHTLPYIQYIHISSATPFALIYILFVVPPHFLSVCPLRPYYAFIFISSFYIHWLLVYLFITVFFISCFPLLRWFFSSIFMSFFACHVIQVLFFTEYSRCLIHSRRDYSLSRSDVHITPYRFILSSVSSVILHFYWYRHFLHPSFFRHIAISNIHSYWPHTFISAYCLFTFHTIFSSTIFLPHIFSFSFIMPYCQPVSSSSSVRACCSSSSL